MELGLNCVGALEFHPPSTQMAAVKPLLANVPELLHMRAYLHDELIVPFQCLSLMQVLEKHVLIQFLIELGSFNGENALEHVVKLLHSVRVNVFNLLPILVTRQIARKEIAWQSDTKARSEATLLCFDM